ncbi:MAG: lipase family protein, partial [Hyphomicrobiales bacterium]|nr:lipase family protein [Hyphomicrobiales bacterium]
MTVSNELMYAILSMDSYNRGYGEGISGLGGIGTNIGAATFTEQSDTLDGDPGVTADFYAAAYSYNGETVISYRGTDNPFFWELPFDDFPIAGKNDFDEPQVHLASQFFRSVVTNTSGPITTTGHSLGGALAGFTGSLYGSDILAVDPIDFFPALLNLKTLLERYILIKDDPNAATDEIALPLMGTFPTVEFAEEQLAAMGIPLTQIPFISDQLNISDDQLPKYVAFHLSGSIAIGAREAATPSTAIDLPGLPNMGLTVGPIDAHSASLNVIIKYVEGQYTAGDTDIINFTSIANPLLDALFINELGVAAGIADGNENGAGLSSAHAKMRDMIAYSALDEGTLVFGNTGIRSMFDDAEQLGLIASGEDNSNMFSDPDADIYKYLSNVIVEFAGLQAYLETDSILSADGSEPGQYWNAVDGILEIGSLHSNIMRVDLTDFAWRGKDGNPVDIYSKDDLFARILAPTENLDQYISAYPTLPNFLNYLHSKPEFAEKWGAISSDIFDTFYMRTDKDVAKKDIYLSNYGEIDRKAWETGN